MPCYQGTTFLYTLENVHITSDYNFVDCRFPVQRVIRPQSDDYHDFRGYAGKIESGIFKPGDEVIALPSGFTSKIKSIDTMEGPIEEAFPPQNVIINLEDDIDISRGDMIVKPNNQPHVGQDIEMMICWLHERKIIPGGKYAIRHTTKDARCIVKAIRYKVDINTLHKKEDDLSLGLNEIGRIQVRTTQPFFYDSYKNNRGTGSVILIDENTNETVGAGMII
jgi:sulfate adenylyltransferase subunit 1